MSEYEELKKEVRSVTQKTVQRKTGGSGSRACLKNHSRHLHAPLCGIFGPDSVSVAHYDSFIGVKSPTKCDAQLSESIFQTRPNLTGIPDHTKNRLEDASGFSMDDVRVHYHSALPAKIGALAYTKGTEVFMGAGQEKHLNHELWHVVQQKQGRVTANTTAGGQPANDDVNLEREADRMG